MAASRFLLLLAFSALVFGGIIPLTPLLTKAPNPNDILQQVNFAPLSALSYAEPVVWVSSSQLTEGCHKDAYLQVKALYPQFAALPVDGCNYATYGQTRFYVFVFESKSSANVSAKTAVSCPIASTASQNGTQSADEKDGYSQVSADWAQKDPKISNALYIVIKNNWVLIGGNPLSTCWVKPVQGVYTYRFYFRNVSGVFQYHDTDNNTDSSDSYYTTIGPVFSVGNTTTEYVNVTLADIQNTSAYAAIVAELTKEIGNFNASWVVHFSASITNDNNCFRIVLHILPTLIVSTYEATYYGSIQKASLLKIDQSVFNGAGADFTKWQEVQNFNDYKLFKDANQYVLYQFTWMRFYKIVTAYSALHLNGRYVRLAYAGIQEDNIDPNNQINIVIFIDKNGCFYFDRNDFHATNLNSYGRNNWVSLFITTPNVTEAEYYMQIVHFFKSIYPKFWSANQLTDIKFKGNLHVVQFRNPTNIFDTVLYITQNSTSLLNKVNWTRLDDNSPLKARLESFVQSKYNASTLMFISYYRLDNGTHFEVSYLDKNGSFAAAYVLYIEATDVFTNDNLYTFNATTYSSDPAPLDLNGSITSFLAANDASLIAIVSIVSLSSSQFAVIGLTSDGRWQINVQWKNGAWTIVSKQPVSDGYFTAQGFPSSLCASNTGFLGKLYPMHFGKGYKYVSIETKTVGFIIYNRNVYAFGGIFVEAIVQSSFGVDNSQILVQWSPITAIKVLADYGYGVDYKYSYNVDSSLLYQDNNTTKASTTSTTAPSKPNLTTDTSSSSSSSSSASSSASSGSGVQVSVAAVFVVASNPCPPGTKPDIFTKQCVVVFGI